MRGSFNDKKKDKFADSYLRKGGKKGKKSKHDRKALSLAKKNSWLAEAEDDDLELSQIEEHAAEVEETLTAEDYGYEEAELSALIELDDAEMDLVGDAYDRLDALADVIRYLPSVHPYLDEDFHDLLDEATGLSERILDLGAIDNKAFLEGLDRQVAFLERLMADAYADRDEVRQAEKEDAEKAAAAEAAARERAEAEAELLAAEEEEERARVEAEVQAAKEKEAEALAEAAKAKELADALEAQEKEKAPPPRSSKKKRAKGKKKKKFVAFDWAKDAKEFPQDFDVRDYSGVVAGPREVWGVDEHFMARDRAVGYYSVVYDLVPNPGAPLAGYPLVVHAHFYANGRYRNKPKVMRKDMQGATDGTRTGSSKCFDLRYGVANSLGI